MRHIAQSQEQAVRVSAGDGIELEANLTVPENAIGVVLFAHGSGSSRHSPRNRAVAEHLNEGGMATLLFDLLTRREEAVDIQTAEMRFDIKLLADRLAGATQWTRKQSNLHNLPVGYFGASTGGGAALVAAAKMPRAVAAVVSRGGRPDLAGDALHHVSAPTLLIVGGNDVPVIHMNQEALDQMHCERKMQIIPGATHLFEEPGALDQVAHLAREWFAKHLPAAESE